MPSAWIISRIEFSLRVRNGFRSSSHRAYLQLDAFEECRLAAEQAVDEPYPEGPDAVDDVYTDVVIPHPWTRTTPA